MPTEEKRQTIHQQTDTDQQYLLFAFFMMPPAVSVACIAKEFGVKATLDHCTDGELISDELAKAPIFIRWSRVRPLNHFPHTDFWT